MRRSLRFDFGDNLHQLMESQYERERFLSGMGDYAQKTDDELLRDITRSCDFTPDRDKVECRLGLKRLSEREEFFRHKMDKRIKQVVAAMDADPPERFRRRNGGRLLRGLILLFLLRRLSR